MKRAKSVGIAAVAAAITISTLQLVRASGGSTLFIQSIVENPDGTATIPLQRGTSHGQTVFYVMTDTSDGDFAQRFGLNRSQKLPTLQEAAAFSR